MSRERRKARFHLPQVAKDFIENSDKNFNMSGSYKVYQFIDETNGTIFYIGCTVGSIKKRFYEHVHSCVMHHMYMEETGDPCGYLILKQLKKFIDGEIKISINVLFEFDNKEKAHEIESMLIYTFSLGNGKVIDLSNKKNSKTTSYKRI